MGTLSSAGVLVFLLLLQAKHWICDAPLQTSWMLTDKGTYGRSGGLAHAALHGAGTALCTVLVGAGGGWAVLLGLADAVLHYHVDYAKQRIVRTQRWTHTDDYFWWAMTFDQLLHQVTYLALAAALVALPA